jgi:hypothetical protein
VRAVAHKKNRVVIWTAADPEMPATYVDAELKFQGEMMIVQYTSCEFGRDQVLVFYPPRTVLKAKVD